MAYDNGHAVRNVFAGQIAAPVCNWTREGNLTGKARSSGTPAIDRRVARTRARLHEALLSLLAEKGYDAISVEDICARADVGRSTFYGHFTSKQDLMRSGLRQLRDALHARQRAAALAREPPSDGLTFGLAMAEHARDHAELHRALAGNRGGAVAFAGIREILCELIRNEFVASAGKRAKDEMPQELAVQYVVGAYMAVLAWWLDSRSKLSATEVDAMFRRLTIEGVPGLRR